MMLNKLWEKKHLELLCPNPNVESCSEDSLHLIANWITSNTDRFRFSSDENLDLFSTAKPLGELCLVLSGICSKNEFAQSWKKEMISKISSIQLDEVYTAYWKRLSKKMNEQDAYYEIVQLFLITEKLSGRYFSFHKEMIRLLRKKLDRQEKLPLAIQYSFELAGLDSCHNAVEIECTNIIRNIDQSEILQGSDLYELTHVIFYGSKMGQRPLKWGKTIADLPFVLRQAIQDRLQKNDLDLVAELLFCLKILDLEITATETLAFNTLCQNIQNEPNKPLIHLNKFYKGDRFDSQYHLALTTLLVLQYKSFFQT